MDIQENNPKTNDWIGSTIVNCEHLETSVSSLHGGIQCTRCGAICCPPGSKPEIVAAATRRTFILASPGSEEEFLSWIGGFDKACKIFADNKPTTKSKPRKFFVSYVADGIYGDLIVHVNTSWNTGIIEDVRVKIKESIGDNAVILFYSELENE